MSEISQRKKSKAMEKFERKINHIDRQASQNYEEEMVEAYIELGKELKPGARGKSAFDAGVKAAHGSAYGVVGASYLDGRRSLRGGSLN